MMRKKHLSRFQWLGKRIRNRHFPSFASQLFPRFTSSKTSKKLTNSPPPLPPLTFLPLSSSSIGHSRSTDHFWALASFFVLSSFRSPRNFCQTQILLLERHCIKTYIYNFSSLYFLDKYCFVFLFFASTKKCIHSSVLLSDTKFVNFFSPHSES
jgi:hypothetical protein